MISINNLTALRVKHANQNLVFGIWTIVSFLGICLGVIGIFNSMNAGEVSCSIIEVGSSSYGGFTTLPLCLNTFFISLGILILFLIIFLVVVISWGISSNNINKAEQKLIEQIVNDKCFE